MTEYKTLKFLFTVVLFLSVSYISAYSQGLKFLNPVDSIDKRTSFNVFARVSPYFTSKMEISFDIQIPRTDEVGYIMRITDSQSGRRYNIFYDGRGNDRLELNEEGKKNIARLTFDKDKLRTGKWTKFSLVFDFTGRKILMAIGDRDVKVDDAPLPLLGKFRPQIVFGRCDYLIDVPSFTMRDLSIKGGNKEFFFPLTQGSGNDVYDSGDNKTGSVDNPYWAINDQFHWKKIVTLKSPHNAGACYDSKEHRIYYYSQEQVTVYDIDDQKTYSVKYSNRCPVDINLGMSVMDSAKGKLYIYEVYKHNKPDDEPSVASLDIATMTWQTESTMQLASQRHHHGLSQYMPGGKFFIFGGFGNMKYSDNIATFDISTHQWEDFSLKGKVQPRYFTSLGCDDAGRQLYIFAGMGNETGQQSIGRRYFYDFYRMDLPSRKTSKLWQLKCGENYSLVPVRSMIVKDGYFVTLCYPEFLSNSHLRLFKFSIKDGSHEILGDSIPIHSDKIATNANIYYDEQLSQYFVTVQEFSDDIASSLSIYSINAQPLAESEFKAITKTPTDLRLLLCLAGITLFLLEAGCTIPLWRKSRRKQIIEHNTGNEITVAPVRPNSIYLFGGFMAFDRKGNDISYMFTNKLCELTIILLSRGKKGLQSRQLGTMLWGDKDTEKIKNLRSVTINHLRKVLREMDGIQLVFSEGAFRLVTEPTFYIDSNDVLDIIEGKSNETKAVTDTTYYAATDYRLLQILKRGKFLRNINTPNLDDFKTKVETILMPTVFRRLEYTSARNRYAQIIDYAEIVFHIDPYNIKAYQYKMKALLQIGKSQDAQDFSRQFRNEYRRDYGEELKE